MKVKVEGLNGKAEQVCDVDEAQLDMRPGMNRAWSESIKRAAERGLGLERDSLENHAVQREPGGVVRIFPLGVDIPPKPAA